ncbi:MAG: acyl carrier protein [Lachnospiraceae bacterium]|nr:acyl carrier protein [Lachnospiraceae bacterium]
MNKITEFKNIAAQYCSVKAEDMNENMRFREDLGFSSLDFMSFLGELEDQFDVDVEEGNVLNVRTIGEALTMLNSLTEA